MAPRRVRAGQADGGEPAGGLLSDGKGGFFGTASQGGPDGHGEVFHLKAKADGTWKLTTVHAFAGGNDGAGPTGDLLTHDGKLYGVTEGDLTEPGTVYMIAP